jgi:hypothetical protein
MMMMTNDVDWMANGIRFLQWYDWSASLSQCTQNAMKYLPITMATTTTTIQMTHVPLKLFIKKKEHTSYKKQIFVILFLQ